MILGCTFLAIGDGVRIFAGSADSSILGGVGWFIQAFGAMLVTLGLPALYVVQAEASRWLALAGFIGLSIFLFLFGIFGGLLHSLVVVELARTAPGAAVRPVTVALSFFIGSMGAVLGGVAFGAAVVRGHRLPNHAGFLTMGGGLLLFIGHPIGLHVEDVGLWLLLGGIADSALALVKAPVDLTTPRH